jgi:predicted PurR-regulated permease PerM
MQLERLQRVLIWLLITAASVFLLERVLLLVSLFATPLLLFGLAWLMALALRPLVDELTQVAIPLPRFARVASFSAATHWQVPRSMAAILVYMALFAVIVVLGILLVPPLLQQLTGFPDLMIAAVDAANKWIVHLEEDLYQRGWRIDLTDILRPEILGQPATSLGSMLAQQSFGIASGVANVLVDVVLVIILSFYMTLDGPRLITRLLALLPHGWRSETRTLLSIVDRTFGGFLRAQILQALFYGLATAALMIVLGLTDVTLASVLATLLVLIPLIGGVFAIIPPLLIALIEEPDRFFLLLVGLLLLQQVLFNVVMPRLMGKIVGLHPLLIFGAILVGASVAGAWGVLFGIPVAGVIASVLQFIYMRAMRQRAPAAPAPPLSR